MRTRKYGSVGVYHVQNLMFFLHTREILCWFAQNDKSVWSFFHRE